MNQFSRPLTDHKKVTVFILLSQNGQKFTKSSSFPTNLKNLKFNTKCFYNIEDFQNYIHKHQKKINQKYGKLFFIVHNNKKFSAYDNECNLLKEIQTKTENTISFTNAKKFKTAFLGILRQNPTYNFITFGYKNNTIKYIFATFKIKKERFTTPKKLNFILFTITFIIIPLIIFIYLLTINKANTLQKNLVDIILIITSSIIATTYALYSINRERKEHFITLDEDLLIYNAPNKQMLFIHYSSIDQINFYKKKIILTYHTKSEISKGNMHKKITWKNSIYDIKAIKDHLRKYAMLNSLIIKNNYY